ncbi:MAG: hypothetical protein K5650_04970 [Bacteroidales bacterium]|nr:hypothetical protein [Bacteroidales bacterium]
MKRFMLTLLAAVALLAASAQAPVEAAADSATPAVGVAIDSVAPVAPAAAAVQQPDTDVLYEPFEYQRPRHSVMRYFGHDFCTVFGEFEFLMGNDLAAGFNIAYVPNEWGVYGSYMYGIAYDWFSIGAVRRLSHSWNNTDCQLFFGLNIGDGLGYEVGLRFAGDRRYNIGSFCWNSVSLGLTRNYGHTYLMLGLSLDVTGFMFFPLLFW